MADRFLWWLIRRLRPARGWLLLLLAGMMALLLPLSLEAAGWLRRSDGLWLLALAALVTGAWLASRRWSRPGLVLLALVIGGLLTIQWVSPFLPSLERLLTEASVTRQWLAAGAPAGQVPWLGLLQDSAWQLGGVWRDVAAQGDRAQLLRFIVALLVGSSSFWLAWWLFRGPGVRPWRAALPAGALLAVNAFFAVGQEYYLVFYLLTLLGLVAWGRWFQLERSWQDRGSDFPSDLGPDQSTAAVAVGAAALVMILVVPHIVIQPAVNWFWQLVRQPWEQVEEQAEALFPGMVRGSSGPLASGILKQGLPRAHLLGSGPELRDIEVLRVVTNATGVSFTPRWREITYAVYTGRGWQLEDEAALEDVSVPAGRTWRRTSELAGEQGGGLLVEQRVDLVQGSARLVVAAGEPQTVSTGYRAVLRGPDDAVALEMHDPQRRFIVQGAVEAASEEKLRIVNYSKTIPSAYLKTADVPARVRELAANIVAPATNPYDQAKLLEAYLRTLTYDLNVPPVAEDRDLVDAFLFDIQRGYCDYFASAFVVMARSVGLPARLAVGYASGREVAPGQWVVTEADAHSWPEVYFEGVGWIPFEPTPAQPPSSRPVAVPSGEVAVTGPPGSRVVLPPLQFGLLALGLVALGAVTWLLLRTWRVPHNASETYARLTAWGTRLGQPPRPGDTMRAYAAAITGRLASLARDQSTERLAQLIRAIVAWCEAALFAPVGERPAAGERQRLWRQWQRTTVARGRLWIRQAFRARHER
jgi:transglutaminase-like putative cysteine protease